MFKHNDKIKRTLMYRFLNAFVAVAFVTSMIIPPQVQAQTVVPLPAVGSMVMPTPSYIPALIKGITIHPENPLEFDFIVEEGEESFGMDTLKMQANKMIKYFLATLTVPEDEMWVNLSPYEKDRMIPKGFGETGMGRDLLAQDYILKQLTASLMYPEKELGQKFWSRVYQRAQEEFGTSEIPMNTFNKVWIVPERAVVYEKDNSAFVIDSHLKVLLEEDYVALKNNMGEEMGNEKIISGVQSSIIEEIIIPEIEKEVNNGESFAALRQIYNSVILATWFKNNLKESLLGQIYVDQNKTKGIDLGDKHVNEKIYEQYLEAFSKGVYNYIREDVDPVTKEIIPRKYFSGGTNLSSSPVIETIREGDLGRFKGIDVELMVEDSLGKKAHRFNVALQEVAANDPNIEPFLEASQAGSVIQLKGSSPVEFIDVQLKAMIAQIRNSGKPFISDISLEAFIEELKGNAQKAQASGGLGFLAGETWGAYRYLDKFSSMGIMPLYEYYFSPEGEFRKIDWSNEEGIKPVLVRDERTGGSKILSFNVSMKDGIEEHKIKVYWINRNGIPVFLFRSSEVFNKLYPGGEQQIKQYALIARSYVELMKKLNLSPRIVRLNEPQLVFVGTAIKNDVDWSNRQQEDSVFEKTAFSMTTHTPESAALPYWSVDWLKSVIGHDLVRDWDGAREIIVDDLNGNRIVHAAIGLARLTTQVPDSVGATGIINGVALEHKDVTKEVILPDFDKNIIGIQNGSDPSLWYSKELSEIVKSSDSLTDISGKQLFEIGQRQKILLNQYLKGNFGSQFKELNRPLVGLVRRLVAYKEQGILFPIVHWITGDRTQEYETPWGMRKGLGANLLVGGLGRDEVGEQWVIEFKQLMNSPNLKGKLVFVNESGIELMRLATSASDIWVSMPRATREASGTSDQRAALNGHYNIATATGGPLAYIKHGQTGWLIDVFKGRDFKEVVRRFDSSDPEIIEEFKRGSMEKLAEYLKEGALRYFDYTENGNQVWINGMAQAFVDSHQEVSIEIMIQKYGLLFESILDQTGAEGYETKYKQWLKTRKGFLEFKKGSSSSPIGKTVLVVDDSPTNRYLLQRDLVSRGFSVVEAVDGVDALSKLKKLSNIDIVVTDLKMPNLDGVGLVEKMAKQGNKQPIIMITGDLQAADEYEILVKDSNNGLVGVFDKDKDGISAVLDKVEEESEKVSSRLDDKLKNEKKSLKKVLFKLGKKGVLKESINVLSKKISGYNQENLIYFINDLLEKINKDWELFDDSERDLIVGELNHIKGNLEDSFIESEISSSPIGTIEIDPNKSGLSELDVIDEITEKILEVNQPSRIEIVAPDSPSLHKEIKKYGFETSVPYKMIADRIVELYARRQIADVQKGSEGKAYVGPTREFTIYLNARVDFFGQEVDAIRLFSPNDSLQDAVNPDSFNGENKQNILFYRWDSQTSYVEKGVLGKQEAMEMLRDVLKNFESVGLFPLVLQNYENRRALLEKLPVNESEQITLEENIKTENDVLLAEKQKEKEERKSDVLAVQKEPRKQSKQEQPTEQTIRGESVPVDFSFQAEARNKFIRFLGSSGYVVSDYLFNGLRAVFGETQNEILRAISSDSENLNLLLSYLKEQSKFDQNSNEYKTYEALFLKRKDERKSKERLEQLFADVRKGNVLLLISKKDLFRSSDKIVSYLGQLAWKEFYRRGEKRADGFYQVHKIYADSILDYFRQEYPSLSEKLLSLNLNGVESEFMQMIFPSKKMSPFLRKETMNLIDEKFQEIENDISLEERENLKRIIKDLVEEISGVGSLKNKKERIVKIIQKDPELAFKSYISAMLNSYEFPEILYGIYEEYQRKLFAVYGSEIDQSSMSVEFERMKIISAFFFDHQTGVSFDQEDDYIKGSSFFGIPNLPKVSELLEFADTLNRVAKDEVSENTYLMGVPVEGKDVYVQFDQEAFNRFKYEFDPIVKIGMWQYKTEGNDILLLDSNSKVIKRFQNKDVFNVVFASAFGYLVQILREIYQNPLEAERMVKRVKKGIWTNVKYSGDNIIINEGSINRRNDVLGSNERVSLFLKSLLVVQSTIFENALTLSFDPLLETKNFEDARINFLNDPSTSLQLYEMRVMLPGVEREEMNMEDENVEAARRFLNPGDKGSSPIEIKSISASEYLEVLNGNDKEGRLKMLKRLAENALAGDRSSEAVLIQSLSHPEEDVRQESIKYLGQVGGEKAIKALLQRVFQEGVMSALIEANVTDDQLSQRYYTIIVTNNSLEEVKKTAQELLNLDHQRSQVFQSLILEVKEFTENEDEIYQLIPRVLGNFLKNKYFDVKKELSVLREKKESSRQSEDRSVSGRMLKDSELEPVQSQITSSPVTDFVDSQDRAVGDKVTPGGIDLNPNLLDLQIKRDGNGIPLPLPQQSIELMNIEGFLPVIINVTPITNLPLLLGFDMDESSDTGESFDVSSLGPVNRIDYYVREESLALELGYV